MRIPLISILFFSLCFYSSTPATIIHIPEDYLLIQQGIDHSNDGDTVLVQPGTYYENIDYNGHNIVLSSLYLTTGDTSYISSTIIDGNNFGRVVIIRNSEGFGTILTGFTIQHGNYLYGSGIYCANYSTPIISDNIITENIRDGDCWGGGIFCSNSNPIITNNLIKSNQADICGGGIFCGSSDPIIAGNVIIENLSNNGGGICCYDSEPVIQDNIISGNLRGGGVYLNHASPYFINNTICMNNGRGIRCDVSDPIVNSCLIWANDPYNITSEGSVSPAFKYCNIGREIEGEGNISSNPIFPTLTEGNYNICSQSPCIDAGDPSVRDPDGTRSDIGKYYSEHPSCELGNRWYVSPDGNDSTGDGSPGNPFRTIQHGVVVSLHSDTILVENGIYEENITVYGKGITLASNYIFSQDTVDISNTVIQGDSSPSAIFMCGCNQLSIEGFTISNYNGNGVKFTQSNCIIKDNLIQNNNGDGIIGCYHSYPYISSNIISNNYTGIYLYKYSEGTIINNTIVSNLYSGIYIRWNSTTTAINNIIWGNVNLAIKPEGNPLTVSYCNLNGGWEGTGNTDLDPMFIPNDRYFNVCALSPCIDNGSPEIRDPDGTRSDIGRFYSAHPECETGNKWYVSTTGNDTTGNGSYEYPYRTIQYAVEGSFSGDTIIVENGLYTENVDVIAKSLLIASNYLFTGDTLDIVNTIVESDSTTAAFRFFHNNENSWLIGFKIQNGPGWGISCSHSYTSILNNFITANFSGGIKCDNSSSLNISLNRIYENSHGGMYCDESAVVITYNEIIGNLEGSVYGSHRHGGGIYSRNTTSLITNNVIMDNFASGYGAGLFCSGGIQEIRGNIIKNNSAGHYGGGIFLTGSDPIISNNLIVENETSQNDGWGGIGGGICCWNNSNPTIINNTFYGNTAEIHGGGIGCQSSSPFIINNILWEDYSPQSGSEIYPDSLSEPTIWYNDIRYGWNQDGNIRLDPLFRDPENGDFHIMATYCGDPDDSPCIDAGYPEVSDSLLDCDWGLGELRSDMGAYAGDGRLPTDIDEEINLQLPTVYRLFQNYPNPFNSSTTIRYSIPEQSHIQLDVYNLLGQRVETLVNSKHPPGEYGVIWNAMDYSSGIYFYKLTFGDAVVARKMVLLK